MEDHPRLPWLHLHRNLRLILDVFCWYKSFNRSSYQILYFFCDWCLPKNSHRQRSLSTAARKPKTQVTRLFVSVLERWSSNSPWKGPVHGGLWFGQNVRTQQTLYLGGFWTALLALRGFAHLIFWSEMVVFGKNKQLAVCQNLVPLLFTSK